MTRRLPLIVLLLSAAGFAFGVLKLFTLRFEVGDVYPAYSSLRSDPLGTMALCESLGRIPGLSVHRDFSALSELPDGHDTTYLHLAARTEDWYWVPDDVAKTIDGFVARGGRLVITFFPRTTKSLDLLTAFQEHQPKKNKEEPEPGVPPEPGKPNKNKKRKALENEIQLTSLKERWGIELSFAGLEPGKEGSYEPGHAKNQTALPLPEELDWHSGVILTNLNETWRTIYARGTYPVLAERKFGSGAVVLATDSYFVSNEAMLKDRHPDLLAWLIGPNNQVVFDEAHFGLTEEPGVSTLIRRYRLQGLAVAVIVFTLLFVWKNAFSLAPPHPDRAQAGYVAGKESAVGFVNLLQRNIPPQDLLKVCLTEWKKSFMHSNQPSAAKVDQAQAVADAVHALPGRQPHPVETYKAICQVLSRRTL